MKSTRIKRFLRSTAVLATILVASFTVASSAWSPNTAPHSGISFSQYPDGYQSSNNPVVTFNSYTDFPASLTNIKQPWDQTLGNTIYQGPLDERHFLRVVKREAKHTRSTYTYNDLDFGRMAQGQQSQASGVQEGDTLVFWVYIHNNAAPGANDANNVSGAAIAKDVNLRVDLGGNGTSIAPTAYLSASNAKPQRISSDTLIQGTDKFSLEPIGRNGGIYHENGFRQFTLAEMQSLLSGNGIDIGSEYARTDEWLGCSQHQRWVTFEVEVKKTPELPKECKKLTIEPQTIPVGVNGEVCATIDGYYKGQLAWDLNGSGDLIGDDSSGGSVRTTVDTDVSNKSCVRIGGVKNNIPTTLTVRSSEDSCQDEISNKNIPNQCTGLKIEPSTLEKDGEYCVSVEGSYAGNLEWTSENADVIKDLREAFKQNTQIDSTKDNKSCITVNIYETEPTSKLTVKATEPGTNAACQVTLERKPEELVCKVLEFTKRPQPNNFVPGEYCVKADPANSYTGPIKWSIEGKGEFDRSGTPSIDSSLSDGTQPDGITEAIPLRSDLLVPGTTGIIDLLHDNPSITTNISNGQWCTKVIGVGDNAKLKVTPTDAEVAKQCNLEIQNKPGTTPPVCQSLEYTKRPSTTEVKDGLYCVKANPADAYTGLMQWTISGKGGLNQPEQPRINPSLSDGAQPDGITEPIPLREDLLLPGAPTISTLPSTSNKSLTTTLNNGQWCAYVAGSDDDTKLDIRPTDSDAAKQCKLSMANTPTPPPPGGQCEEIQLTPTGPLHDGEYCVSVTKGKYKGDIEWTTVNADAIKDLKEAFRQVTTIDSEGSNKSCITINDYENESNSKLTVRAIGDKAGTCEAIRTRSTEKPPVIKKKPKIEKNVKRVKDGANGWRKRVTVPYNGAKEDPEHGQRAELVQYRIDYTFETTEPVDVNIIDIDLAHPENPAYIGRDGYIGGTKGGRIDYSDRLEVLHGDTQVQPCNANNIDPDTDVCFEGDIDETDGILVRNATHDITIYYTGRMNSIIDDANCQKLRQEQDCAERFFNHARGVIIVEVPSSDGKSTNRIALEETDLVSNDTQVMVPCRFFLTRAGGDVFFEDELGVGVDAQFCGRRSTTGIIIKRREETQGKIPSTGLEDIQTFSHEVCQLSGVAKDSDLYNKYKDKIEDLPDGYIDPISDFSSLICEIQLATASDLNKDFIKASLDENIQRIARWNENLANKSSISESDFTSGNALLGEQVLRKKGDLTISSLDLSKIGQAAKQFGAKTIIVEGDLTIKGDIKYPSLSEQDFLNPREIPSLSFIVLGGDIKVDPKVTELSGVYFVQQEFPGDTNSGRLTATTNSSGQQQNSEKQLTIYGQVFGDIKELFQTRLYSGDPRRDEGAIVIRYDERIILNTPPGLEQIIDLNQVEVAR